VIHEIHVHLYIVSPNRFIKIYLAFQVHDLSHEQNCKLPSVSRYNTTCIILHVSVNGETSSGRTKRQCGIDLLYQISILKIGHAFFLSN